MRAASHTFVVPVRPRRSSANVLVEDAICEKLRERRRVRVYAAYKEAAQDARYVDELNADMAAFDPTLTDAVCP
jgi:hypothetical protein